MDRGFSYLLRGGSIHFFKDPHKDLVIGKTILHHQLRDAFIRFQKILVKIHGSYRIYVCKKCLAGILLKQAAEILTAQALGRCRIIERQRFAKIPADIIHNSGNPSHIPAGTAGGAVFVPVGAAAVKIIEELI